MFRKLLLLTFIIIFSVQAHGQDTIVLITGRVIPVLSVDFQEYRVAYKKIPRSLKKSADNGKLNDGPVKKKKSGFRTMDPLRIFSIKYRDGSERIIYQPDSLDPMEFTQEQMRMFIRGEQDATKYYKNNLNKGIGFGLGAGAGLLGFYGLAIPPLYATIMGSFTPNLTTRLKRQNELKDKKAILDQLSQPAVPAATESNPEALKSYDLALKNYNSAVKDYDKALKRHPKNIEFSDTELFSHIEYREGYEKKARDRKIRNAMLSGLAGFVLLVVGLPIIY